MVLIEGIMGNDGRVIDMRTPVDRMSDRAMDSLRNSYVPLQNHDRAPPIEPIKPPRELYPYDIRADAGPHMGLIGKPLDSTWGVHSRTPDPLSPILPPVKPLVFEQPPLKDIYEPKPRMRFDKDIYGNKIY